MTSSAEWYLWLAGLPRWRRVDSARAPKHLHCTRAPLPSVLCGSPVTHLPPLCSHACQMRGPEGKRAVTPKVGEEPLNYREYQVSAGCTHPHQVSAGCMHARKQACVRLSGRQSMLHNKLACTCCEREPARQSRCFEGWSAPVWGRVSVEHLCKVIWSDSKDEDGVNHLFLRMLSPF